MARPKANEEDTGHVFKGNQSIRSELFKLEIGMVKKNHGTENSPLFLDHEHTHTFRTFDSSGRGQETATPIAGHFHEVKVTFGDADNRSKIEVGPAVQYITKNVGGRQVRSVTPIAGDNHTHEWTYIATQQLQSRVYSDDYLKFQSKTEARKPSSVPGIIG